MKITELNSGTEYHSLKAALELGNLPIVSVAGAGGKTTAVKRLAEEYGRAAITTTTHMYKEAELAKSAADVMASNGIVWFGAEAGSKISMSPFIDDVYGIPMFIEADGSRHMPFKVPAEHEPVIYKRSTAVIGVLGLDAVGRSIEDAAFRPHDAARFLGTDTRHIISCEDMAAVICSKDGLMKGLRGKYYVLLTKADSGHRMEHAYDIARRCGNIRIYAVDMK